MLSVAFRYLTLPTVTYRYLPLLPPLLPLLPLATCRSPSSHTVTYCSSQDPPVGEEGFAKGVAGTNPAGWKTYGLGLKPHLATTTG